MSLMFLLTIDYEPKLENLYIIYVVFESVIWDFINSHINRTAYANPAAIDALVP